MLTSVIGERLTQFNEVLKFERTLERSGGSKTVYYLEGRKTSCRRISEEMVNHRYVYMLDYVMDDSGRLSEIRCDKLNQ